MTTTTSALGAALWQNANSLSAPTKSTTVTLESLARQLDHMLTELSSLRDDVNVLTAIVQRLDNSHTRLLTESRAIHSQVSRHGERLCRLESLAPTDSDKSAEQSE
jgi:hypothetical protein